MLRRILTGVAVVATFGLATVVPAYADVQSGGDPAPTASFVGPVVVAYGGTAGVTFTYTCHNDADHPLNHLFVAVKQGPRINTTDRSSSEFARTFYSTNWSPDAGPNALTCNGEPQTQTVLLMDDPFWANSGSAPLLHSGPALVQICLFDNAADPELNDAGFVFDYTIQRVLAAGGRSAH